jgi:hypothetical protein
MSLLIDIRFGGASIGGRIDVLKQRDVTMFWTGVDSLSGKRAAKMSNIDGIQPAPFGRRMYGRFQARMAFPGA